MLKSIVDIYENLKNIYYKKWLYGIMILNYTKIRCDAPKPGGPLTTRQPAEFLYVSYRETHTRVKMPLGLINQYS